MPRHGPACARRLCGAGRMVPAGQGSADRTCSTGARQPAAIAPAEQRTVACHGSEDSRRAGSVRVPAPGRKGSAANRVVRRRPTHALGHGQRLSLESGTRSSHRMGESLASLRERGWFDTSRVFSRKVEAHRRSDFEPGERGLASLRARNRPIGYAPPGEKMTDPLESPPRYPRRRYGIIRRSYANRPSCRSALSCARRPRRVSDRVDGRGISDRRVPRGSAHAFVPGRQWLGRQISSRHQEKNYQ